MVREETDKKTAYIQARSFLARKNSGRKWERNAKLQEKHKWSDEKPKLCNARRVRGIYFIDPEDKEFKETIKNARKKLETPVATAMPRKTSKTCKHGRHVAKPMRLNQNLRASWKPVNPPENACGRNSTELS